MDKEQALEVKSAYEFYQAMMESPLGARLNKVLADMENSAVRAAMHGDLALTEKASLEARGKYQAVERIRREFDDIKKEYQEAEAVLKAEVIETAPVNTSA